ncbi:SMC-Scp complex subunit ScpB [Clostridium tertium]|uniref:Segregation and condensation protein B n=1 Tax=Clostridium tertium TaxID=1559 RepID=A0A9X4AZW0_9CLOT|nr:MULTISPECIES: SMC-Scp complex subunit ScpB [Clostridium]EEH97698.1 segregation and condensation protein B [Clostridium sp. 7_2_43FAA]MBP1868952.1 segregation and condensation protein B [Clostridium tertium]MBS5308320.1 segregation/condensation protein B [Clostridium sp.]MBS6502668.1 segregation/condensation protein B [Clostridium sp.]MBU6135236.1 segregation/condensation protein B [Clostridium tertium]
MSKTEVEQYEFEEVSSKPKIKSAIEALLFVSGEPLTIKDLSNSIEVSPKTISNILNEMILDYEEEKRGIKLISINGEYQLVTKAENSDYIQKLLKKNKRQSLSQASLESLAIIAYKQPITRVDIDEIRGVKSESAIHKLLEKDLIKEVGRLEVPGRPILFGTTEEFLRQFGLKELNELPSLDLYSEKDEETIEAMNEIIKEI